MGQLRSGTYIRESDGGTLVYHSDLTTWNMPKVGLKYYLDNRHMDSFPEIDKWRHVTDEEELADLNKWLAGSLKPGEHTEITGYDLLDWREADQ